MRETSTRRRLLIAQGATAFVVALTAFGCARPSAETRRSTLPGDGATDADRDRADRGYVADLSSTGGGDERCGLGPVYFAYDRYELDARARTQLHDNAQCILRERPSRVRVTGMADPRGTTEYNLALGDRRARAAAEFVRARGVESSTLRPVSVGEEYASGSDETSWASDRRADFEVER